MSLYEVLNLFPRWPLVFRSFLHPLLVARDVVTPERLSRRNQQKYKPQTEQRSAGGMTSSNVKNAAKLSHDVVAVLNSLLFAFP